MASNKESLKYWKYENIFFVSTGEDGSAMLPALVFPSINEVGCAMKELQDNHEALHGVHHSQEVESACQLQFLEIMLQGDSNECLIWLDPTQKPRIETVDATRRRVAFQKGFLDWVLATGVPSGRVEGYVKVICLMLKQAQGEKSSTKVLENSTASTEGMKMTTASATTEKTSSKSSCPVETIEPKEASLMSSAEPERSSQQEKESKDAPTEKSKPVDDQAEPMDTTEDTNCKDPMLVESIKNSVTETSQAESNETDQAESTGTGDVMATTLGDSGMDIEKPDTQSESVAERSMTKDNGLVESRDQMESTSDAESSSMKSPRGKQGQKNKTQPARVSMTPPVRRSNRKVKSPNSSNSIVSASEEEDFEYVDSKKVVPILKRAGFVLKKNCYALPGCRESFSSLEELRRDICKHGMPNSDEWNTEERTLLEKWIRQSIFRTGDYSRGLPSNFEEFGDFKDMKRVAAFNYYDLSGLGCRYTYPGVSKEHSTALCHGVFDSEKDLLVSLARHGLPENLYKILSKEELLGLEVYVDMKVYPKLKPDFFCREPPYSDSPRKRSRAVRSEESVTSGTGSPSGRSKKVPKTSSSRGGFHPMATPTKSTKAAVEPSTPMTTSTSCTNLVSVDALPWPPSMDPVTEIEGTTDFERLEKAQALLGRKDVTVPVFDTESSLGLNLKKIHDMVCAVIRTAGRHGGDSPCGKFDESSSSKALYVCGVPGTGKTMSVTWICQHVLQAHRDGKISVERDDDEEDIEWNFLIQNANRVADVRTFRRNITEALGRKGAFSTVLKQKETGLVLVVDEIDSMIGKVEWERFLTELLEFANNETFHFALIGISNSVMDEKYAKILEFGKFLPTITFSAYNSSDLTSILRHRIGSKLMDDRSLEFIAKKCMNEGGDVRRALGLALEVVKARIDRLGDDTTSVSSGTVIGFKDVFAISQVENRELVSQISGLPEISKACLVALSALGQVQVTETTIGKLRSFVGRCTKDEEDVLDPDAFVRVLETLKDSGLLQFNAANIVAMSPRDQQNVVLNLGYQLEDVQTAVDRVCKSEHYQKIASLARNNKEIFTV